MHEPATGWGSPLYLIDNTALDLSPRDRARFDSLPRGASTAAALVRDRSTRCVWVVWRAQCGLECFCAADGRLVGEPRVLHIG